MCGGSALSSYGCHTFSDPLSFSCELHQCTQGFSLSIGGTGWLQWIELSIYLLPERLKGASVGYSLLPGQAVIIPH